MKISIVYWEPNLSNAVNGSVQRERNVITPRENGRTGHRLLMGRGRWVSRNRQNVGTRQSHYGPSQTPPVFKSRELLDLEKALKNCAGTDNVSLTKELGDKFSVKF